MPVDENVNAVENAEAVEAVERKQPIVKPFSMQLDDFKKELVSTINDSNLHPEIIASTLKEVLADVNLAVAQTREAEQKEYYRQIKE